MSRIVGLARVGTTLTIAHGERRLGRVRLVGCERVAAADVPAALARLAARRPALVLAALPAEATAHRVLALPFADRRRLLDAAPLELLGRLPLATDVVVAATVLGVERDGGSVLAVAARRADVERERATLAADGLVPARLDVAPLPALALLDGDGALVVADGAHGAVLVRRDGRLAGHRALGNDAGDAAAFAAEVRWSVAALGGAARLIVVGPDAAGVASALGPAASVLDGEATKAPVAAGLVLGSADATVPQLGLGEPPATLAIPRAWRRSVALAAAAVLLLAFDVGVVRWGLDRRLAALDAATAEVARAARPDLSTDAAIALLEASAGRPADDAGDGLLETLRELSARVPPSLALDVDELDVDADGLRLHGRCTGFDGVDALRRALAASPQLADTTIDETRATVDGGGVEFRLHAARRPVRGAPS